MPQRLLPHNALVILQDLHTTAGLRAPPKRAEHMPANDFLKSVQREQEAVRQDTFSQVMEQGVGTRSLQLRTAFLGPCTKDLPTQRLAEKRGHIPFGQCPHMEPRLLRFATPVRRLCSTVCVCVCRPARRAPMTPIAIVNGYQSQPLKRLRALRRYTTRRGRYKSR